MAYVYTFVVCFMLTENAFQASAVLPHMRKEQTKTALRALGIPDDQMLQKCGVTVGKDLTVVSFALASGSLVVGNS